MYDNRVGIVFHRGYSSFSPLFYFVVRGDVVGYALDQFLAEMRKNLRESDWKLSFLPDEFAAMFTRYVYENFPAVIIHRIAQLTEEELEELRAEHKITNLYGGGVVLVDIAAMEWETIMPEKREQWEEPWELE